MGDIIDNLYQIIWGKHLLFSILLISFFLTARFYFYSWHQIFPAFRSLLKSRHMKREEGAINPFNALMTSLSATVGTGNIVGIPIVIMIGGAGAIFWMWIVALFGMVLKMAEAVLAMKYRSVNEEDDYVGGPMFYISKGLGGHWKYAAFFYAFALILAGIGTGNMIQAHSIVDVLTIQTEPFFPEYLHITPYIIAAILFGLTTLVLVGGIQRISRWAGKLVPLMMIIYVSACLFIIISNIGTVPAVFEKIIIQAFTPEATIAGGFFGVLQAGMTRAIVSAEVGAGSASIAHASSQLKSPLEQGRIAMLGAFIDTIVICTMTALVVLVTFESLPSHFEGAAIITQSFTEQLPFIGTYIVPLCLPIFAFTTILAWSHYCETAIKYMFGTAYTTLFRIFWCFVLLIGALNEAKLVWSAADMMFGLVIYPNLLAVLFLSPQIVPYLKEHMKDLKAG